MAQYRQLGAERFAVRNNDFHKGNGISDQISSTASKIAHKQGKVRRSYVRGDRNRVIYVTGAIVIFSFTLTVIVFYFNYLSSAKEFNRVEGEDDGTNSELDFFYNGTQTTTNKVLKFGHGSVHHGRDSRDWDRDDRRRDDEYNEDEMDVTNAYRHNESVESKQISSDENGSRKKVEVKDIHLNSQGLYNEAGRDELKHYEEKYEESLKNGVDRTFQSNLSDSKLDNTDVDPDDEYDDGLDSNDVLEEKSNDKREDNVGKLPNTNSKSTREAKSDSFKFETAHPSKQVTNRFLVSNKDSIRKSSNTEKKLDPKRKGKRHKFSGSSCEMKLLSSTAHLIEPSENPKSARFTLQYTEREEKPSSSEDWKPRFAGHQSLQEREASFYAHDQVINCGFVKGKKGSPSTGFDLSEDDEKFMSSCHIAVSSCIFGASDNLRTPTNKSVTRLSRKNVCFVMFVDENTLKTLSSEGQKPDAAGYIGLWRIIVVKNLPYDDMRRVGKIPKFLAHRLFPSARYSIWLDSKLRLERDPLLILEYFLWRHNYDYAISNHYDRHCVWEEVLQNKKLNKFNHTIIDQQFQFYQADGLKRFNPLDSNKLLPSYVPEGSFIVRAHSPMSNLFSCLWFNEVDRFTPRDQLSFAYTYLKMRRMNPDKPFYLNMFKDCERRSIAKLFRHRSEDKRNPPLQSTI